MFIFIFIPIYLFIFTSYCSNEKKKLKVKSSSMTMTSLFKSTEIGLQYDDFVFFFKKKRNWLGRGQLHL